MSGFRGDGDVVEGGLGLVGEGDRAEFDAAFDATWDDGAVGGVGFFLGIEDVEDAVSGGASGEDHLVEGVEAVDGFVEEAEEEEEGDEFALGEGAGHDLLTAESEDEDVTCHFHEGHAGRVVSPPAHHAESGLAEHFGRLVEADEFGGFRGVAFDLADAGDVVVEEGVEVGGGFALVAVAVASFGGIDPCADGEEGDGEGGPAGDERVEEVEVDADAEDLEHGDDALFDAIDEDAFHIGDVFDNSGHDVAGAAGIEPVEWEELDFRVEVGADVEDDFLLEVVVYKDAGTVEGVADEEGEEGHDDPEEKFFMTCGVGEYFIDGIARDAGEDEEGCCHAEGAEQLEERQFRVTFEVGEDAQDRFHAWWWGTLGVMVCVVKSSFGIVK